MMTVSVLNMDQLKKLSESSAPSKTNPSSSIFLFLTDSAIPKKHLSQMLNSSEFSGAKWVVFKSRSEAVESYFMNIYVPFNREVLVVEVPLEPDRKYMIQEVYQVAQHMPLKVNYLGTWHPSTGLETNATKHLYHRRTSLDGLHVNVAIIFNEPLLIVDNVTAPRRVTGFFGRIWDVVVQELNITFTVLPIAYPYSGSSGMMKQLTEGRAAVAIGGVSMVSDRLLHIDFSIPLSFSR